MEHPWSKEWLTPWRILCDNGASAFVLLSVLTSMKRRRSNISSSTASSCSSATMTSASIAKRNSHQGGHFSGTRIFAQPRPLRCNQLSGAHPAGAQEGHHHKVGHQQQTRPTRVTIAGWFIAKGFPQNISNAGVETASPTFLKTLALDT